MNPIIVDEDSWRPLWRTIDCAEYCGVKIGTWSSYVTTGHAPAVAAYLDARTPLWDADEVKGWHANRRGQAWRAGKTD